MEQVFREIITAERQFPVGDDSAPQKLLRHSRPRLRFSKKVSSALMDEAVSSLAQAKAMHDDLEAIYNPYVDFDRVKQMALDLCGEILQ